MKGMTGEEFILTIKRDSQLFVIPVVILSASNNTETVNML